jgi:hypothetical protein
MTGETIASLHGLVIGGLGVLARAMHLQDEQGEPAHLNGEQAMTPSAASWWSLYPDRSGSSTT